MIFEILLSKTFQLDFNLWNEYIKDVLASDIRWLELRSLEILDLEVKSLHYSNLLIPFRP